MFFYLVLRYCKVLLSTKNGPTPKGDYLNPQTTHKNWISPTIILGVIDPFLSWNFEGSGKVQSNAQEKKRQKAPVGPVRAAACCGCGRRPRPPPARCSPPSLEEKTKGERAKVIGPRNTKVHLLWPAILLLPSPFFPGIRIFLENLRKPGETAGFRKERWLERRESTLRAMIKRGHPINRPGV